MRGVCVLMEDGILVSLESGLAYEKPWDQDER